MPYDPSTPQITGPWRQFDAEAGTRSAASGGRSMLTVIGCALVALAVIGVLAFVGFNLISSWWGNVTGHPNIYLSSTGGPAGSTVSVSGNGFSAGEQVIIRFHVEEVARTTADANGGFTGVQFKVPASYGNFPGQQFSVVAEGQSSIKSATAPYTVGG